MSLYVLAAMFVVCYFIVAITLYIYRLLRHPLARYPGRLYERVSDWPLVYYCFKGNRHIRQYLAHQKYGPIIRDAPNSVSFSTATAFYAIYGPGAPTQEGKWYRTLDIAANAPSIQMAIDQITQALSAFKQKALCDAEPRLQQNANRISIHLYSEFGICSGVKPVRMSEAEELLQQERDGIVKYPHTLEYRVGFEGPINLREVVDRFGFDLLSDLAFGRSFGLLSYIEGPKEEIMEKTNRWVPGVLRNSGMFSHYSGYLPLAAPDRSLVGIWVHKYLRKKSQEPLRYMELVNARLAERIAEEEERIANGNEEPEMKDIIYYLLRYRDAQTGRAFTTEELQADTSLLIAEGSHVVATTIAAVFFYAMKDPRIWKRLVNEIRTQDISTWSLKCSDLDRFPYLHACVEEALRLVPPQPTSLPRTVLPGGAMIDSHFIPAGTTVGVSHYTLHRDPEVFPSPAEFRPERWLAGSASEEQMAKQRTSFAPFGIGPMSCIGEPIAYLAIKVAIASMIRAFDIKLHNSKGCYRDLEEGRTDDGEEYQMWDCIIGYPEGPLVDVKQRHSWEEYEWAYKWDG